MNRGQRAAFVAQKMIDATEGCKTLGELSETLLAMSFSLGGLIVELEEVDRQDVFAHMVEMMSKGFADISNKMGQPSNLVFTKVERK